MNRFEQLFSNKPLSYFPFFVCGFPDMDSSFQLICNVVEDGADALELGIPFSDPIADGPVIQQACDMALKHDYLLAEYFSLINKIRIKYPTLPIGLLVYSQLIEHHGIPLFYTDAASAGVDGILVADVPVFENQVYATAALNAGIDNILIAAPSCSHEALAAIAKQGSGFTYVVTRKGVTGNHEGIDYDLVNLQLERLSELGAAPSVLGFGIKSSQDIELIKQTSANGYIIGSHLVQKVLDDLEGHSI